MALNTAVKRILLATLLGVGTPYVLADSRPFGVLPEGQIRLDSPAAYDAVVTLSDGRLLVEGEFARVDGERVPGPVLLDANGRLLRALAPRCVGQTVVPGRKPCRLTMLALSDGGFVVAGSFDQIDGSNVPGIARYRADGTLDAAFTPVSQVAAGQQPGLVGERLGHLYFRTSPAGAVQRIPLSPPHTIDPDYLAINPGRAQVLDNAGVLYFFADLLGVTIGVRRRFADGTVDPDFIVGLPNITSLWHDPVTNGVFMVARDVTSAADAIVRIRPAGGIEPDWSLEPIPTDGMVGTSPRPLAVGHGRVLSEQFDGSRRWLVSHDALTGRILAASALPVPRDSIFFASNARDWIAVPPATGLWPDPASGGSDLQTENQLIRIDRALQVDSSLDTDLHQIGASFAAATGNNGTWLIGGEFSRVQRQGRVRVARLQADWRVDPLWDVASAAARPWYPIWRIGETSDGFVAAAEFRQVLFTVFPPMTGPHVVLAAPSGSPAQRRSVGNSAFRGLTLGPHLYGSQFCRWLSGSEPPPVIWRTPVARLFPPHAPTNNPSVCDYDFSWRLDGPIRSFTASPDGWLYYASQEKTSVVIRRIRGESNVTPDPSFLITLPPPQPPLSFQLFVVAATSDAVYVSLNETSSGNGRVLRYLTSTGAPDPSWPTVTRVNAVANLAADAHWVYLWDQLGTVPSVNGVWELTRRSAADGSVRGTLRAVVGNLPTSSGQQPEPSIMAIGDGRAIASWRFVQLGGIPRDGFAIVGSVEAILADGFE
jgi:hypothetical protein